MQNNSEYFPYKDNILYCDEISVPEIIKQTGTPVYIYNKRHFVENYNKITEAFKGIPHTIFYAAKSNFNLSVIKTFVNLGSGVDVNSEGELIRALKAGAKPEKIILTGVGKTYNEIELGIKNNLLMIKAESLGEIELINNIAEKHNKKAHVAIRVNPDINPQTHPYISTGLYENKFGINVEEALEIFKNNTKYENIIFNGIDMHIGSQITNLSPFVEAVSKLSEVFFQAKEYGINFEHFDIGGGIGVVYKDETPFNIKEFANALIPLFKKLNCQIFFEPGRFLTANSGILVTEVLNTKKNRDKNFIIIDAAMNDLLRPSLYKVYHHIQPIFINNNDENIIADIVGPVCETGDFLAKEINIKKMKESELLAIMSAGAYGMVMSSNYNARRRPPEVLVDKNKFTIIRSRESYEHLIFDEEKYL